MLGKDLKKLTNNMPDDLPILNYDPRETGGMIDFIQEPKVVAVYEYETDNGTIFIDKYKYDNIKLLRSFDAIIFQTKEE